MSFLPLSTVILQVQVLPLFQKHIFFLSLEFIFKMKSLPKLLFPISLPSTAVCSESCANPRAL